MSIEARKGPRRADRVARHERATTGGSMPAIGLEAEFTTVVDDKPQRPEDVFGSPRKVIRGPLVHRTGRSYHLPTGGALYFDTGVMEIATPMIEIARGCGARGTRSLWENLGFLRSELDAWESKTERTIRLVGFSAQCRRSQAIDGASFGDRCSVRYRSRSPPPGVTADRRPPGVGRLRPDRGS